MPGMNGGAGTGLWTGSAGCSGRWGKDRENQAKEPEEKEASAGVGIEGGGRNAMAGTGI